MKRVLLVVAGGIAAYKALEVARGLKKRGIEVRAVLTRAGAEFVTPLSLAALTEDRVYTDLFSLTDESEMGHIKLSRDADLLVVAPATANLMAKMAHGLADDLASTALLATDKPVLVAPAMNVRMWRHPATEANLATLRARGVSVVGPDEGPMACGEHGPGRLTEPEAIIDAALAILDSGDPSRPLVGLRALVTSGPTHEPIDPVRYIANRSSGKQGHAIAAALAALGAETILVTGPTKLEAPAGVTVVPVETADTMLVACRASLPADVAVCAAAVADWAPAEPAASKLKKEDAGDRLTVVMRRNPDILASLSEVGPARPGLVVGFAAETNDLIANAHAKLSSKGCDWIAANDVSPETGIFGGERNRLHLITGDGPVEQWPSLTKTEAAARLAGRIAAALTSPAEEAAE